MIKTPATKSADAKAPAATEKPADAKAPAVVVSPFSPFYAPTQFDTPRDAPGADRMGPDASGFVITPPAPNVAMNALIRGKKKAT